MSSCREMLSRVAGGRVLDVGCGTGHFTRQLAETLRDVRSVIGIDPDKDSVDEARRATENRRITYRLLSVMDLAEEPERFDTVAIGYALHHLPDPAAVIRRMASVLVPGGAMIVSEPVADGLSPAEQNSRDLHHFKAEIDRLRGRVHNPTYDRAAIRALVQIDGLEIVDECTGDRHATAGDGAGVTDAASADANAASDPVQEAVEFLDEYLPFAEGTDRCEDLRSLHADLIGRIRADGIDSPPRLIILARKRQPGD